MDQTLQLRPSIWRFSLRELLLVTLAVAAFLGWGSLLYQQYHAFVPTSFFVDNSDWSDDIVAILNALGLPEARINAKAESYGNGPSAAHRTIEQKLPLTKANCAAFLDEFQQRVLEKLSADNCRVRQTVGGGGSSDVRTVGYLRGPVAGAIHIFLSAAGDDQARLVIAMHEERRPWLGEINIGVVMVGE
ncbi:MAG TPA: hypothetical protein VGI40_18135 [Pirellulaceae bacterium]